MWLQGQAGSSGPRPAAASRPQPGRGRQQTFALTQGISHRAPTGREARGPAGLMCSLPSKAERSGLAGWKNKADQTGRAW